MAEAEAEHRPTTDVRTGGVLRSYRKRAGLTQAELADHLQVSQPLISMIEVGSHSASLDQMRAWLRACGLDAEDRTSAMLARFPLLPAPQQDLVLRMCVLLVDGDDDAVEHVMKTVGAILAREESR